MVLSGQLPSPAFELLSEFPLLQSSLPCDIHLVNLRTIQSKVNAKICLYELASYVLDLVQGVSFGAVAQQACSCRGLKFSSQEPG